MSKNELSQSMNQETKELLNQLLVSGTLDKYIENKASMSIPQIFDTLGEDGFRELEKNDMGYSLFFGIYSNTLICAICIVILLN